MLAIVVRRVGLTNRLQHLIHSSSSANLHIAQRYASNDRSRLDATLQALREDIELRQKAEAEQKKEIKVKLPLKQRIVHELKHYYHGFRLLLLESRVSTRYLIRLARGNVLTRRERQQLVRTVSDLLRLVPFSFFIVVPFMEFALPFFIKLFPNMLPSTFQDASKEQERIRKQMKLRVEMAKFLQDTLEEIGHKRVEGQEEGVKSKAYEFAQFARRVRTQGAMVTNEDIFKYAAYFEDEMTLDNMPMSQLRALCRMLGIQPLGTDEVLRFQLMLKLRDLKSDDKLITLEGGVEALSIVDLQSACRARGMRALGLSEERLREQMRQWLELSLDDKVPPSLLLLSRALYLPEDQTFAQRFRHIITDLPDTLSEEATQKLTKLEGGSVDYKERLALIRHIEAGLKEERDKAAAEAKKKQAEEKKAKEAEEQKAKQAEEKKSQEDDAQAAELLKYEPPKPLPDNELLESPTPSESKDRKVAARENK